MYFDLARRISLIRHAFSDLDSVDAGMPSRGTPGSGQSYSNQADQGDEQCLVVSDRAVCEFPLRNHVISERIGMLRGKNDH